MNFQFDARSIGDVSAQGEVWPAGWYPVVAFEVDAKPASTGTGHRLTYKIKAIDGPFRDKINYIGLNLVNASAQAVEIAYKHLAMLCWVTGRVSFNAPTELLNIPFMAYCVPSERGNNWQNFKDMAGNEASAIQKQQMGGGAPQQAPQSQPPQQAWGVVSGATGAVPPQAPPQQAWGSGAPAAAPQPGWGGAAPQGQPPGGFGQAPAPAPQPGWNGAPQGGQPAPAWGAQPQGQPAQQFQQPQPPQQQSFAPQQGAQPTQAWGGGAPAQPPAGFGGAPQQQQAPGGWQPGQAQPGGQPAWGGPPR